jgi:peptide/nickel transport system permease protein/glutathione transport system permease protein
MPSVLVGLSFLVLGLVVLAAVAGTVLAPQDPSAQDPLLGTQPPSADHLLGTDELGRDIASRLVEGARAAVLGPLAVALLSTGVGLMLGMCAGYYGGRVDSVIARLADLLYSLPALLIAIVVVGLISPSYPVTIGVLAFLTFPGDIRIFRSVTMVQTRLPYVDAARTLGLSGPTAMRRHVLPNMLPTVVSTFLLDFAGALVAFSALAFLGLGVETGSSDWGTMMADGQRLLFDQPAMSVAPAVLLIMVAASATIVGDWLYDRFTARTAP